MNHEFFKMETTGKKVSRLTFEDINDCVTYLKNARTNTSIFSECSSKKVGKERGWHDFETYKDALIALEYGTEMYFSDFKKNFKKVKDYISEKEKKISIKYKKDIIGFIPIVPNVLINNPVNMINSDIKLKPITTVKIFIDKGNSASVNTEDMNNFYTIIFALIQLLEDKGIRCEVWAVKGAVENNECICEKVKLKNYMQPLNIYKIQFPIMATDFSRRIGFRLLETNHDIKDKDWYWSYGHPVLKDSDFENSSVLYYPKINEFFNIDDTDIFIPSCQFFNYNKEQNLDETINNIISKTNLKNILDFI